MKEVYYHVSKSLLDSLINMAKSIQLTPVRYEEDQLVMANRVIEHDRVVAQSLVSELQRIKNPKLQRFIKEDLVRCYGEKSSNG